MSYRTLARVAIASAIVLAGFTAAEAARRTATSGSKAAMSDQECMARAMYFESNRTREDGMLAVGTVVANRLASGRYASTVCGVVSQPSQFAPGVLTRRMAESKPAEKARKVAEAVLNGMRHPAAGDAMFFHTANVPFRNDDKTYVLVSGDNAFYRWNRSRDDEVERENLASFSRAFEEADRNRKVGMATVVKAVPQNPDDAPVLRVATLSAPDPLQPLAPPAQPEARPETVAQAAPQLITVAAAEPAPVRVAQEIVDGRSALSKALAFRGEPSRTPAANEALSVVMSLAPPTGARKALAGRTPGGVEPAGRTLAYAGESDAAPRVVAPAAPVFASATPIFRRRAEPATNPMANLVVAQAWTAFD